MDLLLLWSPLPVPVVWLVQRLLRPSWPLRLLLPWFVLPSPLVLLHWLQRMLVRRPLMSSAQLRAALRSLLSLDVPPTLGILGSLKLQVLSPRCSKVGQ